MEVSRGFWKWFLLRCNQYLPRKWLHDKSGRDQGGISEYSSRLEE